MKNRLTLMKIIVYFLHFFKCHNCEKKTYVKSMNLSKDLF